MRRFAFLFPLCWCFLLPACTSQVPSQAQLERPNIVWLVTEDNSQHFMRLYQESGVSMPHIDALAEQGITFDRVFSNGPVCSVARSTLISGCYATRVGAQYHRRSQFVPLPEGLHMFPQYLRRAGYYTTNCSKEDYNFIRSDSAWDDSSPQASYRNRATGQPFFHVQNFGITHEGQLHFSRAEMAEQPTQTDPASITPFSYHPNTPLFRYTYAKYHDLHQQADAQIGKFLSQLEADGLMENTVIFYYGDHGGVLPRSKGYVYESGVHVPLVVYVPEKWQELLPIARGGRTDAFVQFIDFAPTVLRLAGLASRPQMDGKPFLGAGVSTDDWAERDRAFSYADRFDEKYDMVRALRQENFKYIRHYQPFNVDALYNFYRYKMLAYQAWDSLYRAGALNPVQQQFFQPQPPEALYDLTEDPHEIHNLAADPAYREVLLRLREALREHVSSLPDLSFFPEPYFLAAGSDDPVAFGQAHQAEIAELVAIADLSLLPFDAAEAGLRKALQGDNPWQRYWGLIGCSSFGAKAATFIPLAETLATQDPERLVRMRALEFLALSAQPIDTAAVVALLQDAKTETEANLMLNSVALIKTLQPDCDLRLDPSLFDPNWTTEPGDLINRRIDFINQ